MASVDEQTNDQREAFEVTGRSLRVSYQVGEFDDSDEFNDFTVEITDEFGLVESDSIRESGLRRFTVPEGPGSFKVETDVEPDKGAEYDVIVEDCAGGDDQNNDNNDDVSGGQDNGGNGDDDANDDGVIDDTIPDKDLPDTGGSTALVVGGAALLVLYVGLLAWRLKARER